MTPQDGDPKRTGLEPMLEARSVAVVGASVKEGSLGAQMLIELERGGFEGAIYPVNPGYEEIFGHKCFASIADVPEQVDLAILGVANARIEQALLDSAEAGARSAVTFSSLYEDTESGRPPLTERLAEIARRHGMSVCGGNGMGFLALDFKLRATGFSTPDVVPSGPVSFISHSGSAFAALAFNDRGLGFNLIVSSGQEIVTTMSDYMEYALGLPTTRVVALLLETVRDPVGFRAQLSRAAEMHVPVVALKVGRTEGSKAMVTAHSGALAGEHGAYEALFDAYGVLAVETLDEMVDTLELLSAPRRVTEGRGIASIHDSGGERALFVDVAHDLGVPFAEISDATRQRIQDGLDPGVVAANPLDAWGTGIDADRIFRDSFLALHDDPDTAAMAFVVDMTTQGAPYDTGYLQVARDTLEHTTKPFCIVSNLASAIDADEAAMMRADGIPVLEGASSGLRALRHLIHEREYRQRAASKPSAPVPVELRDRWLAKLSAAQELSELEALQLLGDYGVPTIAVRAAEDIDAAVVAADAFGYPVVMKTAVPGIHHKSDVGGVKLGLGNAREVRDAYADLAGRLGPRTVVAAMAPSGIEVALGVVRDPTFGPLVLVAAGGVLVELLKDRKLAFPPLDEERARALIDGVTMRPMLDGLRGGEAADVRALAYTVSRLSVLAADLGQAIDALDVNPVIVSADGCVAVDALVISRTQN